MSGLAGGAIGGGRGGGAGRGGAAPAPPVATVDRAASTPQEMAAANTEKAIAAMTTLVRESNKAPMVLTLRAANEQDFARLANALATFTGNNFMLTNRVVQMAQAPLDNVAVQQDPRNGVRPQNASMQNGNFAGNMGNNATDANNRSLNTVTILDNSANGANSTNGGGYATPNLVQIGNGTANGMAAPNGDFNSNQFSQQQNIANLQNRQQFAAQNATQGGPYLVTLRADQLRQLATDFRVAVVARGADSYVFRSLGDRAVRTEDATARDELLKQVGLNYQPAAQTARGNNDLAKGTAPPSPMITPAAPAAAPGNDAVNDQAPVECVITMDPPTPANGQ